MFFIRFDSLSLLVFIVFFIGFHCFVVVRRRRPGPRNRSPRGVSQSGVGFELISRNVAETILNAIVHSGRPSEVFGLWRKACANDYLDDPEAVLGPGPEALGELIFGSTFGKEDFDAVHALLNQLIGDVKISLDGEPLTIARSIKQPANQALWGKLVSGVRNYANQGLGQHVRKDKV